MSPQDIKLPKSAAELSQPQFLANIHRAEQFVNALQNLKVRVSIAGTTRVVVGHIRISGESAIIEVKL